jgi:hypothetical protein
MPYDERHIQLKITQTVAMSCDWQRIAALFVTVTLQGVQLISAFAIRHFWRRGLSPPRSRPQIRPRLGPLRRPPRPCLASRRGATDSACHRRPAACVADRFLRRWRRSRLRRWPIASLATACVSGHRLRRWLLASLATACVAGCLRLWPPLASLARLWRRCWRGNVHAPTSTLPPRCPRRRRCRPDRPGRTHRRRCRPTPLPQTR